MTVAISGSLYKVSQISCTFFKNLLLKDNKKKYCYFHVSDLLSV